MTYNLANKVYILFKVGPFPKYKQAHQSQPAVYLQAWFYISLFPLSIRILPVDLSDSDATRAATEKARELFGQIDIHINNAGMY